MALLELNASSKVNFDLFNEELIASPYSEYERLRSEDPVHWNSTIESWILTRIDDIRAVLNDRAFEAYAMSELVGEIGQRANRDYSKLVTFLSTNLFFENGSDHRRDRRLLSQVVNRTPLSVVEGAVRDIARALAGPLYAKDAYDAVSEFANPFPQCVMACILGLPPEDVAPLSDLLSDLTLIFDTSPLETYDRVNAKVTAALQIVKARVEKAEGDTGSALGVIYAGAPGTGREKLENAAATVLFTFRVGAETTVGLIGMLVRALIDKPKLRLALKAEPALAGRVVSEVLRLESNVQRAARVATEARQIGGKTIGKGQRVILLLGAGNRDPAAFAAPDEIGVDGGRHDDVSFGAGAHYCLGASLAQLEGRIALETFLDLPPLERAGEETWYAGRTIRRLTALPVRVVR